MEYPGLQQCQNGILWIPDSSPSSWEEDIHPLPLDKVRSSAMGKAMSSSVLGQEAWYGAMYLAELQSTPSCPSPTIPFFCSRTPSLCLHSLLQHPALVWGTGGIWLALTSACPMQAHTGLVWCWAADNCRRCALWHIWNTVHKQQAGIYDIT